MLTFLRPQSREAGFCDGLNRRDFMQIGGAGAAGLLSLPRILQAESELGVNNSGKGVIICCLTGGPPHQDMVDLKPDAPAEIRGEFNPISTNVPGIQISELFPRLATMTDKVAIIRSIVGGSFDHSTYMCYSGRALGGFVRLNWPAFGSMVSKLRGPVHQSVPPYVSLTHSCTYPYWAIPGEPGFLGQSYRPFEPTERDTQVLQPKMPMPRFMKRKQLLDDLQRTVDRSNLREGFDQFGNQAFDLLTSNKVADALNLENVPQKRRDRYGKGSLEPVKDGPPMYNPDFLLALRLIQAGVRVVNFNFSRWDWHGENFKQAKKNVPALDQALTGFLEHLYHLGLENDISIVVWGEFGRTPTINTQAGRDHWHHVTCALLAGGGMKTGQVIGATDKNAAYAIDRPVHFQEVFATLYHNLGIDPQHERVHNEFGRPIHLLDGDKMTPIPELVG